MSLLTLSLKPVLKLTEGQFARLCGVNPELLLERTAAGELQIMSPTGGETGLMNAELVAQLVLWNRQTRQGIVFDSSTGFHLPNGAIRSPDVAWIRRERWEALSPSQKRGFVPLCPDFALELCSPTDEWEALQAKLREYLANGLRLGWLIDPAGRVEIYRPGQLAELQTRPATLSGENVLPGFVLNLTGILKP